MDATDVKFGRGGEGGNVRIHDNVSAVVWSREYAFQTHFPLEINSQVSSAPYSLATLKWAVWY